MNYLVKRFMEYTLKKIISITNFENSGFTKDISSPLSPHEIS